MKPLFFLFSSTLWMALSGCQTPPATPGHASVTLWGANGEAAATVATVQPGNAESPAEVRLVRSGERVEIGTSTGRSRAVVREAVAGLSLWTVLGGLALLGGLLLTGWHLRTGITLAAGGVLMAVLAQIFGQSWFPAAGLLLIAGAGFLFWGYRVGILQVGGQAS